MKNQRILWCKMFVLITCIIASSASLHAQRIKLLKDTVTEQKRNPRLIFAEDHKVYALSSPSNSSLPYRIEQLVPRQAIIKELNFGPNAGIVGRAIRNNRICLAINDYLASNYPRIVIIDIPTGNTVLDTIYALHTGSATSFTAVNNTVADSIGNFYVNLTYFDSTGQRAGAHIMVEPTGSMQLRVCDSITYPEAFLASATENECSYALWMQSIVRVNAEGNILRIDSFPVDEILGRANIGNSRLAPQINGSDYFTVAEYGLAFKIKDGKAYQTILHADTLLTFTDVVVTDEEAFFLIGRDSLENVHVSQQTKDGVVITDTLIQKRGPEEEMFLSQSSYEEQNGSITIMQMLRTQSEFYTRFLNFGRVPHAPVPRATVNNQALTATIHWNVPLTGGLPITSYVLQYKKHSDVNWNTPQTVLTESFVISNLVESQEYDCRLQAVNELGASMYSNMVTFNATGNVGLKEYDAQMFSVFPNPVKAGGVIQASGLFELYDLLGNKLMVSDIAPGIPGIYIIHVTQSGMDTYQKLVVE